MATIRLGSIIGLQRSLRSYGPVAERSVVIGLRKAARFGQTAAVRTTTRVRDPFRIRASGTYGNSWQALDIPDGAIVVNTAAHAVFVERGRRPGKMPPKDPIENWVYQKRLVRRKRIKKTSSASRTGSNGHRKKNTGSGRKIKRRNLNRSRSAFHGMTADEVVHIVRLKIARKGTKGRFVLRKTMPQISKRARRDVRIELRNLSKNPPRG